MAVVKGDANNIVIRDKIITLLYPSKSSMALHAEMKLLFFNV